MEECPFLIHRREEEAAAVGVAAGGRLRAHREVRHPPSLLLPLRDAVRQLRVQKHTDSDSLKLLKLSR